MTLQESYQNTFREAVNRLQELPVSSPLREIFETRIRPTVEQIISNCDERSLELAHWPYFYGLITSDYIDLQRLHDDVAAVAAASSRIPAEVAAFLGRPNEERTGGFLGGLFDLYVKAVSLRAFSAVELDAPLTSHGKGKNCDVRCRIGRRSVRFESTVISEDDESRDAHARYFIDKIDGKSRFLRRPGPDDPSTNAKGPSHYYDAGRIYLKIFDKIACGFDPRQTQLSDSEPNLICLSFAGPGASPRLPAVRWVLDELFGVQPRSGCDPNSPGGSVALLNWIERRANELIKDKKLTDDAYIQLYNDQVLLKLIRRISGILLFDSGHFHSARLNYNCGKRFRIRHVTIARIEREFRKRPACYIL
ncbi:MAG: hypothetical protein M3552_19945 [Planctomycetota bacterium]|nr:hypothetical protein [Planctomycetaceae bacterium]MDQ3332890.1 hypothetical protein [Planctomycetota bacterium]